MKKDIELLNYIYQNIQMAIISLEKIIDLSEDSSFIKVIKKQLSTYEDLKAKCITLLNVNNSEEKSISNFTKIKTYLMINFQTITDKSTSHLAEMLVIGSTMGVIDTLKNAEKYEEASSEILTLLKELNSFEENNISLMKNYL